MTLHVPYSTRPAPIAPACPLQARIQHLEAALLSIAESAAEASLTASGVAVYDLGNLETTARNALAKS